MFTWRVKRGECRTSNSLPCTSVIRIELVPPEEFDAITRALPKTLFVVELVQRNICTRIDHFSLPHRLEHSRISNSIPQRVFRLLFRLRSATNTVNMYSKKITGAMRACVRRMMTSYSPFQVSFKNQLRALLLTGGSQALLPLSLFPI